METRLLATKVRIPPAPRRMVTRARLSSALDGDVPRHRLTVVSAPAGYGKTTLLADWARASSLPVAWLTLSEHENDFERFFRYLLRSWELVEPDVGGSALDLLLGGIELDQEAVLAAFVIAAEGGGRDVVFVLDDYHLIEETAIHAALAFLLEHFPPHVRLVVSTRGEPPLPLARYRARGELLELQAEDLRFQLDETREFLRQGRGNELDTGAVASLHEQLEGWAAALQLAASSLQRVDSSSKVDFSGRHRYVADYFATDVLAGCPEDVRQFLLQTCVLDRLSGALCDAVTGAGNSQAMLEALERDGLFLVPLDESREWYRYHRLFADFLRSELRRRQPDERLALHARAARWYLERDLPEEAFHHAVAGEDVELVIRIVDLYFATKLFSGEVRLVRRWLAALPEGWYASHPMLGLAPATYHIITGSSDTGLAWVARVERRLAELGVDDPEQLAKIAAIRCAVACFQNELAQAEAYADLALRDLPAGDANYRSATYHALGDTYRRNGHWEAARECYRKALEYTDQLAYPIRVGQSAHIHGALADLELTQGRLSAAATYWRRALAATRDEENWGRLPLPLVGWFYIRTAELLYERSRLSACAEQLSLGLERAELGGDVRTRICGYLLAARLALTEGDADRASADLERARLLLEGAAFAELQARFQRVQVELWLARGEARSALRWAREAAEVGELRGMPEGDEARIVAARVAICCAERSAIDESLEILRQVRGAAEADGRMGAVIEALALESVARWRQGERPAAMDALGRALRLAEPEGYVRTFADLDLPMARLLQEARDRDVMPEYVDALLAAMLANRSPGATSMPGLPEPLTKREREVLRHLAAGLTNPEIAAQIFISPQTVKKHAGHIFAKLGVHTRTEAAARARELNLLG